MPNKIWDEKPKSETGIDASDFTYKYYSGVKMDVWLEKLRAQEDALRKINHAQFQEIGRLEKVSRGLRERNNNVWDELRRQTERLEQRHTKLEAVKTWYQNQTGLTDTADDEIIELGKILEDETLQNIGAVSYTHLTLPTILLV